MKKLLSTLLICGLLLTSFAFPITVTEAGNFQSQKLNRIRYGEAEDLGAPITERFVTTHYTEKRASDGKYIMYTATTGKPANFIVYNIDDNVIEYSHPLQSNDGSITSKLVYCITKDSLGNIFIMTQSEGLFFKYNTTTNTMTYYGKPGTETAAYHPVVDNNNNVYFGTYPNAKLVKYDQATDSLIDFGNMIEGESYVHSLAIYNGVIYGGGNSDSTKLFKYDIATGTKTILTNPSKPGAFTGSEVMDYYGMSVAGNYLFCQTKVGNLGYIMNVMDLTTETWHDAITSTGNYHVTGYDGDIVYLIKKHTDNEFYLHTYNPATKVLTKVMDVPYTENFMYPTFAELTDVRFPGKSIICVSYEKGCPVVFNLQNGTITYLTESDFPTDKITLRSMETGICNDIILCGYMGTNGTLYNVNDNSMTSFPMGQAEGIGVHNNKYYFGVYTKAKIFEMDPFAEINAENPKQVGHFGNQNQDRPFKVVSAGNEVAFGTVPTYGLLGGIVGLYNPETGGRRVFTRLFDYKPENNGRQRNQSVAGLCYNNGKIYGSTSIFGGLGSTPEIRPAEVFRIDQTTGTTELSVAPNPSKANNSPLYFIGDLSYGPDGKLWAVSNGLIFSLNPDTLEIIDQIKIGTAGFPADQERYIPHAIKWDADGLMYTNANGKVGILDTQTMEFYQSPVTYGPLMTLGSDGHIYTCTANYTNLIRVKVFKNDFQAPSPVTNLAGDADKTNIYLNWIDPTDTDLSHIKVTVKEGQTIVNNVIVVGKGIQKTTISNLNSGILYTMDIISVDLDGNESEAVSISLTPQDAVNPAGIIQSFVLDGSNENYVVRWKAHPLSTSYKVTIVKDGFISTYPLQTSPEILLDSKLVNGGNVKVTVERNGSLGNIDVSSLYINTDYAGGNGTDASPYIISTARHLSNVSNAPSAVYYQDRDIDASSISPISSFSGKYKGIENGYSSIRLNINESNGNNVALFRQVEAGALIQNIQVSGIVSGKKNVAGIAANLYGTINYCRNNAEITASDSEAGGITGNMFTGSTVSNSSFTGKIYMRNYTGGIAGKNAGGTITSCFSQGTFLDDLSTAAYHHIGGIAGEHSGTLSSSYNLSNLIAPKKTMLGGLVGATNGISSISKSSNAGTVSGSGYNGGIVGKLVGKSGNTITIEYCYNAGDTCGARTAGIVGCIGDADANPLTLNMHEVYDAQTNPMSMVSYRPTPTTGTHTIRLDKCYFVDDSQTVSGRGTRITSQQLKDLGVLQFNTAIWQITGNYPYPVLIS